MNDLIDNLILLALLDEEARLAAEKASDHRFMIFRTIEESIIASFKCPVTMTVTDYPVIREIGKCMKPYPLLWKIDITDSNVILHFGSEIVTTENHDLATLFRLSRDGIDWIKIVEYFNKLALEHDRSIDS
jgi:hypothetical protein